MEGGGQVKFYPYKKWGSGKSFSLRGRGGGGHKMFRGSFNMGLLKFNPSHRGMQNVPLILKGGRHESFYQSPGGAQQVLDPQFSHFVAPPPHD